MIGVEGSWAIPSMFPRCVGSRTLDDKHSLKLARRNRSHRAGLGAPGAAANPLGLVDAIPEVDQARAACRQVGCTVVISQSRGKRRVEGPK